MNLSEAIRIVRAGSEPLYWTTLLHLMAIPFLLVGLAVDSRTVLGINPWIKPLKFFVSVAIYLPTLAWLLYDLGRPRAAAWIGGAVAVSMIVENALITMQSLRGVPSHFNNSTPLDGAVFGAMGFFIAVNTFAIVGLLVCYLTPIPSLTPGYLWGIRLGLALFVLGSLESIFMLRIQAHTVGGADGGPGLPFLNWSTKFGDLRVGHFVGIHAIQALPIAGWLIDRWALPYPALLVTLAAVAWVVVFGLLTLQALAGKPSFF